MSALGRVGSYCQLEVYRKARANARAVFELTKRFPREETYSLTDQVRRSSRSVGAQIAEAWAKRRYEKHFVSKLSDADGENQETQHWLTTASDCGYLAADALSVITADLAEVGAMLNSMMANSHKFCRPRH